jgi:homoserine kinase
MSRLPAGHSATVRVPATSANLGPGFDSLGLALGLVDEVTATVVDEPGVRVEVVGEGAGEVPCGPDHLVARVLMAGLSRASCRRHPACCCAASTRCRTVAGSGRRLPQ